ncbi:MAG TPA: cyclic nucleotide-binding domain-containing protein, partial [Gaiellales bacterium]
EIGESMTRREYGAGHAITGEGEGGVGFFLIESGSATVSRGGERLTTLGPGDHFGEVALLAGSERTATVTSDDAVVCWAMSAWVFKPMLRNHPAVALALLDVLARQLAR